MQRYHIPLAYNGTTMTTPIAQPDGEWVRHEDGFHFTEGELEQLIRLVSDRHDFDVDDICLITAKLRMPLAEQAKVSRVLQSIAHRNLYGERVRR